MENLEALTNSEIDARMGRLAKSERKITHLVLLHIAEVQRRKMYLDYGLTSIFQYLTKRHGYCESSAYLRMDAAKVLERNPQLQSRIEDGSVKLSQLAKVQKCVRQQMRQTSEESASPSTEKCDVFGKEEANNIVEAALLDRLENQTSFETDKILATEFQMPLQNYQKIIPQSDGSVQLVLHVSADEFAEIQKAQSHCSHSVPSNDLGKLFSFLSRSKNGSLEGKKEYSSSSKKFSDKISGGKVQSKNGDRASRETSFSDFGERILPGSKSDNGLDVESLKSATQSFSAKGNGRKRKYISMKIKRRLFAEAGNCCEHVDPFSGLRCDSKFQLQVDHIVPFKFGGADNFQNLRILCGIHNRSRERFN